jgi:hypothetical protein
VEREPAKTFRWCGHDGEIDVDNELPVVRQVLLSMMPVAARPPTRLKISGDLLVAELDLASRANPFRGQFAVPPGHHVIRFHSDGQPANNPADLRTLIWRADNVVIEEIRPLGDLARPAATSNAP